MLHAGRQDVAILRRAWATELTNVFDTQIAAGFVGESAQSGYGNLISSVLGLRVGKTASYTRWDARPLTAEQLSYAAEDVAHLLAARRRAPAPPAGERHASIGRSRSAGVSRRATDERDPETAWERLPRVGQLDRRRARSPSASPPGASARRRPRTGRSARCSRIAPLVEIAKRHPADSRARADPRLHPSFVKRRGEAICSRRSGRASRDPPIPREARRGRSDASDPP